MPREEKQIREAEVFANGGHAKVVRDIIVAIGDNGNRKKEAQRLAEAGNSFPVLIHPTAYSSAESLGEGTVLCINSVVGPSTIIGSHCIINTSATIDHDCIIGDYVHIGPGVTMCGGVEIGEGSLIGAGSTIIPKVKIGRNCVVGAGSVVIQDVPDEDVVYGNPAHHGLKRPKVLE
jgi:sugar O-acyltransferase (sialic acid O-acetyltransferase NeuD family)